MSRIGREPITIPAGVTVTVDEHNHVAVKGPKGEISRDCHKDMKITVGDGVITVERPSEDKMHRSLHGLTRTLINNMVVGVTQGFVKNLSLGFSHPVVVEPPVGIKLEAPAPNKIVVSGIDKEAVGAMAAKIRSYREPEPYKGKGIKYEGEHIRRKAGKTGSKK